MQKRRMDSGNSLTGHNHCQRWRCHSGIYSIDNLFLYSQLNYSLIFVIGNINLEKVLSNNKYKSATHRVVRAEGLSRYSYAFFYNLQGEKWVEPLSQFTKEIGEPPKYRGFQYKEYQQLRMRNKTHPPSKPEDVIRITHYAIST